MQTDLNRKCCTVALPGVATVQQPAGPSLKQLALQVLRESNKPHAVAAVAPVASVAGVAPKHDQPVMTIIEVLLLVWAAGLVLKRRGDLIVIRGIKPTTTPELLDLIREHKPQLLAVMTDTTTRAN